MPWHVCVPTVGLSLWDGRPEMNAAQRLVSLTGGPFGWCAARHIIVALTCAYLLAMPLTGVIEVVDARQRAWHDARLLDEEIDAVLAQQVLHTIVGTRAVLTAAREYIALRGLELVIRKPEEWQHLHELAQALPENGALGINAVTGRSLMSSLTPTPPPATAVGRDDLTAQLDPSVDFFVGTAFKGRWPYAYTWPMSKPLRDRQGRLIATIEAALDAENLTPLVRAAGLGAGAVAAIYRGDGTLLLSEPPPADGHESERFGKVMLDAGSVIWTPSDGVERLYIYRRLPDYDVVVAAGLPTAEIAARWHRHVAGPLAILAVVLVVMTGLSLAGLRVAKREELGQERLAEANRLLKQRYDECARQADAARQAAEHQKLLVGEVNHRVKNTLATVQAIATQTLRTSTSPEAFLEAFEGRLLALSQTHNLLTRHHWRNVVLSDIVRQEVAPYVGGETSRVTMSGAEVMLGPVAAITLGMAFHELTTNAVKYGALSVPSGRVRVTWEVNSSGLVHLVWQEEGGPIVRPPQHQGFGSRLLQRSLPHELGGTVRLDYLPQGLRCTMTMSLTQICSH